MWLIAPGIGDERKILGLFDRAEAVYIDIQRTGVYLWANKFLNVFVLKLDMGKEKFVDRENKGFLNDNLGQSFTLSYALRAVRNCPFSIGIYC